VAGVTIGGLDIGAAEAGETETIIGASDGKSDGINVVI
jgi:hypothetical protein